MPARIMNIHDELDPPTLSPTSIEIQDLTVRFGELTVIENMSFAVRKNEFVSLLGPSGCGKSTLLRIISGLLQPSAGEVRFEGQPILDNHGGVRLGMMFQKPLLLPWRTTLQNILLPVELELGGNVTSALDVQRARQMLAMVQLEGFEDAYPDALSGGMQQRVALARALMSDPDILLLDEPFGALDEMTRETLNEELLRIWRNENTRLKTVIMVTHSVSEAIAMSDRIFVFAARPARLRDVVGIPLSHPRANDSLEFIHLLTKVRQLLRQYS